VQAEPIKTSALRGEMQAGLEVSGTIHVIVTEAK
jgi:hypothetical protein